MNIKSRLLKPVCGFSTAFCTAIIFSFSSFYQYLDEDLFSDCFFLMLFYLAVDLIINILVIYA